MTDPAKSTLLTQLGLTARDGRNPEITGLCVDSRRVGAGDLFAALPGVNAHGAAFIPAALDCGAAAVLTDARGAALARDALAAAGAAVVVTEDPRAALAFAAALWFGAQPETVVAVTGTNGKTSVASFTRQIWAALGLEACNIGTTGVEGAWTAPSPHTTPEPITLHRLLAGMQAAGVTHAAMEASSHGLAQKRLDGVQLTAAGFTNFSQDHLDYHDSFDAYFDAKAGLFDRVLPPDGVAVIHTDDPKGRILAERARARSQAVIAVGRDEGCQLRIIDQRFGATGQEVLFHWRACARRERLNLIGGFQLENVLVAAGLVIASGADADAVFATLGGLETVRGRMQLAARRGNGASVFVDYAHTPGALTTALASIRPHVMGRLIVVFGAGGDRDRGKRPLMGQAAADGADIVFVTDDNPRSEDPAAIRAEVLAGCPDATEVGDRAEAILRAVDAAQAGDVVLIAGKGHEAGQVVGDDVFPFDDAEQASVAVAALDGAA